MKKLSFLLSGLIIATSASFAQKHESIVVLDYDKVTLVSSSPAGHGDSASPAQNPDPSGLNESLIVGKYTHRNGTWITEEQQVGKKNNNIEDVDLRYYTGIELLAYVPAKTNKGTFWLELKSDGPDFGPSDPNVQRENWERQFIQYPSLPIDPITTTPMTDQWFKISYDNIISSRKLGMVVFGYRRGASVAAGESSKEIVYFDNIIMNPAKTKELCLYRETFFLGVQGIAEGKSWLGTSNSDMVLYPGTDWSVTIEKGADRWVGGLELKSDQIALEWDEDGGGLYNHSLFLTKQSSALTVEDIDVSGGFTNLKLAFEIKGSKAGVTPKVEYNVDGSGWTAVNMGQVTADWSTKNYTISAASASKVSLRLSGESIDSGSAYIDNLTVYGTDDSYEPSSINSNEGVVDVKVYPNPVTDILLIDGEVDKVELYNAQGAMVYSGSAEGGVDVSTLATGVYVTKVFTPEGIASTKVLKK